MRKNAVLILAVIFLMLCFKIPISASSEGSAPSEGYIVKLKNESKQRMSLFSTDVRKICNGIYAAKDLEAAQSISNPENIEFIEPNYYITLCDFPYNGEPDDPRYASQWWLEMTDVPGAWRSGLLGRGARVAVIDSGLVQGHEDIEYSNVAYKYNFSRSGSETDITDQTGHGSFVTGIIAAQANNGRGISGISDEVALVQLKCFSSKETTVDKIISAIASAIEQNCDVINMSFGMSSNSEALEEAINTAVEKGIIVVAAVGNNGTQTLNYPAAYENVIGVGSVDSDGSISNFSQRNSSVFVTAPGSLLVSLGYTGANVYSKGSGTSYSVPIVSAMAALAKSANKDIGTDDFKSLLISSSKDSGAPGYDTSYGYGIVDIGNFVEVLQSRYTTSNNTDIVSASVSGYPAVWNRSLEEFEVILPAGTVPSAAYSDIEVVTEDSGSVSTASTDDGGLTWKVNVTARDGMTAREYSIRVAVSDNNKPAVLSGNESYETGENAAVPASYDGMTAAAAFSIDDVSGWFYDEDADDVLEYNAGVMESTGVVSTTGTALMFVPAATDAEKTVTVRVRAFDGQFFSNAVLVNVHVGALPASQSILREVSAQYDKYARSADNKDLSADILFYGNTLTAVRRGDEILQKDKDYCIAYGRTALEAGSVTVYKSYLDKLPKGDTDLTFDFSTGNDAQLALTIADTTPLYSVTFMNDGAQYAAVDDVREGNTVLLPAEPARQGYEFMGWYTGQNGTGTAFTSETPVNSAMTLHAYWMEKQNGNVDGQSSGGDGTSSGGSDAPVGGFSSALPLLPQTEFKITVEALAGGTVSGSGTAVQGADTILVIKPDDGFEISSILVDGKPTDIDSLTKNNDGTWSLKLQGISYDRTVKVEFKALPRQQAAEETPITEVFSDVSENAWYKDSVKFVYERQLFNGTGGSNFSPQQYMTRSMFVSVLGRLSGKVDGDFSDMDFSDVKNGSWYVQYVSWASKNRIVSGYGNGSFGPDDYVSREQMALFLYRYAKWKGIDIRNVSNTGEIGDRFADTDDISDWALEAVKWAVDAGIVNGKPGNVFDPKGKATRAEVAVIIHRFVFSFDQLSGRE